MTVIAPPTRFGVEPGELLEVDENREVFWDLLGLLSTLPSPGEERVSI